MLIPSKHSGFVRNQRIYPEGGKGSDYPPPDPRLVEAQIRSMGIQDEAIQEIMANSRTLAPLQKEQMEFALESGRTAYEQSQQDRQWYLGRRGELTGLQDQMISDAEQFDADQRGDKLARDAVAEVGMQAEIARQSQTRGLQRRGVDPSSGRMLSMNNQMSMGEAAAKASAANKVREAARMEGYALTDRATNALAGYPASASATTGQGATLGGMGLTVANTGLAGMNSGWGAANTAAGQMGQNATSMYGAQATAKNQADQIANASDPFNTILGAAAGIGTSWALGKVA